MPRPSRRTGSTVMATAVALVLASAIALGLSGCTTPAPSPTGTHTSPLRLAIVGDSLSAGKTRSIANGLDASTWALWATDDNLVYAGGWAVAGATTTAMAEGVTRIDDTDIVVILAGTNNVSHGVPWDQAAGDLSRIVETTDARHTVVSAIPPFDQHATEARTYNLQLSELAASRGWDFIDPWVEQRDGDFWEAGRSIDGAHPVDDGYRLLGLAIREDLNTLMESWVG
ncbi:SGNH/GDSL hydrolase family protein [Glaciihabitans sp. dw_435]|uniref:SGNH/GDSL hydrolase family protein n=1 Tax=Glaciihabitans sp. dw_435 TaxID=2720081 RepID=UPI001BD4D89D|nr:SGNH/GDSL hydrolase family protein [Glaciihabitans sp. dw_435]